MWLTVDIGNSSAKCGVFDGITLRDTFHMALHMPGWEATFAKAVDDLKLERIAVASVVPAHIHAFTRFCQTHGLPLVEEIQPTWHMPFRLAYQTLDTLGMDRLAAAAGAWTTLGDTTSRPVIAVDAGTAITYEVIDAEPSYLGGPIAPGPELLRQALHQGTAQLPLISLDLPNSLIGTSTHEALQSGVMHGFIASVEGMLTRLDDALGTRAVVVATGGWASLLHAHIPRIDTVSPHLVLLGIQALLHLNPLPT